MKNFNTSKNNRRVCKCCNNTKPIGEFASAGIVKGIKYYRSMCKPCYSIQKKQEWIEKLHQLERKQQQRMGNSPSSHSYEMM